MTTESFVDEPSASPVPAQRWRLGIALGLAAGIFGVELFGAIVSRSLTLFADAGHMLSDVFGLAIALVAASIARRPANDRHTFGFRRAEVFGALANGVLVLFAAAFVLYEGIHRWLTPSAGDVTPVPMLVVAIVALIANGVSLWILHASATGSINLRGAYLEVLGDTVGSATAIVAALIIMLTGFTGADTIASLVIVAIMVPRALSLLRDVFRVLSTSAPAETDIAEIRARLRGAEGVRDVHDVHVWSITSGQHVFSAHIVVDPIVFAEGRSGALLDELGDLMRAEFDVAHSTFQLEPAEHAGHEPPQHR